MTIPCLSARLILQVKNLQNFEHFVSREHKRKKLTADSNRQLYLILRRIPSVKEISSFLYLSLTEHKG